MKDDRAVQIYWCRWVPRGDGCKDKLVGEFGSIKEAQEDGWDVLLYHDEKDIERVGIILPKRFGGRLVSAAALPRARRYQAALYDRRTGPERSRAQVSRSQVSERSSRSSGSKRCTWAVIGIQGASRLQ